jgi:hypothetical protein
MIVAIDGRRFDTAKAKAHYRLDYHDGRNRHTGDLYLSARGTWYVETPSQWANGHRWELIDPAVAVERYQDYLTQDEIVDILTFAKLETE